jgi:hypothetical protein
MVDAALSGVDGSPSRAQRVSIEAFSLDGRRAPGCAFSRRHRSTCAALSGVAAAADRFHCRQSSSCR